MIINSNLLLLEGMSRGDELLGANGSINFFMFIFAVVFVLITFIFKISDWFYSKNENFNEVKIQKTIEKKVVVDKYQDLSKEELIEKIYQYYIKMPDRNYFKPYDYNGYNSAVKLVEKSISKKDIVLKNLNEKSLDSLKRQLEFYERKPIDFSNFFDSEKIKKF